MTRSCVEMYLATTVCISFNGHSRAGHIYLITVTVNAVNVVGSGWSEHKWYLYSNTHTLYRQVK